MEHSVGTIPFSPHSGPSSGPQQVAVRRGANALSAEAHSAGSRWLETSCNREALNCLEQTSFQTAEPVGGASEAEIRKARSLSESSVLGPILQAE